MNTHFRCIHMNEQGQQCDTWFKQVSNEKLCAEHQVFLRARPEDPQKLSMDGKEAYIDLINEQGAICAKMTLEETEAHYDNLQSILATVKAKVYAVGAIKRQKLDDLSDAERKERLAHKLNKEIRSENKEKTNVKKDPVNHLEKKYGFSSQSARDILSMDFDALMEKYKSSKEKNQ